MKIIKLFLFIIFPGCVISNIQLLGQPSFQFTLQTWASYTTYEHSADSITTQMGFGIRRARIRGEMVKGKFAGFMQYDAAANTLHDARIDYAFSKNVKIRMGRFVGPGSQAGGRTSHTAIDFAERSIVGRMWASLVRRGDYRSYGLALIHKIGIIHYEIMASNGNGSINFKPYNTTSGKSKINTGIFPQLDFMVYTNLSDGLSGGMHIGLPNENRCDVSSLTGFLYFHPQDYKKGSFRGKFDFSRVVDYSGSSTVTSFGSGIMGFFKVSDRIEVGARYEVWDPDKSFSYDAFGNITVGANYSPDPEHWKDVLFKLSATFKTAEAANQPCDPFTLHFVWQVYMH